jgi:hypothetical protein
MRRERVPDRIKFLIQIAGRLLIYLLGNQALRVQGVGDANLEGCDERGVVGEMGDGPGLNRRQSVPKHDVAGLRAKAAGRQHAAAAAYIGHVYASLAQHLHMVTGEPLRQCCT